MKIKILFSIIILLNLCLIGCSEEDEWSKLENKEHLVTYKIYSDREGVSLSYQGITVFKDYWETTFVTKAWSANFIARCEDPDVLVTAEIHVDGKLKARNQGNGYVSVGYRIKGEGQ